LKDKKIFASRGSLPVFVTPAGPRDVDMALGTGANTVLKRRKNLRPGGSAWD